MKYLLVAASLAALWWLHRRRQRRWWEFSPDQWERLRARWSNEEREEDRNINDPHKWGTEAPCLLESRRPRGLLPRRYGGRDEVPDDGCRTGQDRGRAEEAWMTEREPRTLEEAIALGRAERLDTCYDCGRRMYPDPFSGGLCRVCLGQELPSKADPEPKASVRYYSQATRKWVQMGQMPLSTAKAWAKMMNGEVV